MIARVARFYGQAFGDVVRQAYSHTLASYIALLEVEAIDQLQQEHAGLAQAYMTQRAIVSAFQKESALSPIRDDLFRYLRRPLERGPNGLTERERDLVLHILKSIERENHAAGRTDYKAEERIQSYALAKGET